MEPNPLIINFTPTGMMPTKAMTPYVPLSVAEIVDQVLEANDLGITLVHLHARDEHGVPTSDQAIYGRIIEGIRRDAPDLVICVSLSGRNCPDFETRAQVLELDGAAKPDMGSLTLSSLNFSRSASINSPDVIRQLAVRMKEKGVRPELEIFDVGMLNYARYLIRQGAIDEPCYYNVLVGNIASAQADLLHLAALIRDIPAGACWSLGGIGDCQLAVNSIAIASGGGVRVGLEDTIWFDRHRTRHASNHDLLSRIHELRRLHERELMTPGQLRMALGLHSGAGGRYGTLAMPAAKAGQPVPET